MERVSIVKATGAMQQAVPRQFGRQPRGMLGAGVHEQYFHHFISFATPSDLLLRRLARYSRTADAGNGRRSRR